MENCVFSERENLRAAAAAVAATGVQWWQMSLQDVCEESEISYAHARKHSEEEFQSAPLLMLGM